MHYKEAFHINNIQLFRRKCIEWLKKFNTFCMLDSHADVNINHHFGYRDYDFVIASGVHKVVDSINNSLKDLNDKGQKSKKWHFGFFSYDFKNSIENLRSRNTDFLEWPDFFFFEPEILLLVNSNKIVIHSYHISPATIFSDIESIGYSDDKPGKAAVVNPRMSKKKYLDSVNKLKRHILRGDIYEVNFCQEFFAETHIDPYLSYLQLNRISPTPFSCFFRLNDKYLISASPERFIKKVNERIISQPIKGTAIRGTTNEQDTLIKRQLASDPKEKAENIMIVDLVRNDLSKIAAPSSVKVDELCGIYSFSHVHQMISTISANLTTKSIEDIIKATFPMGSMTGAPKIRAMELAEQYETTKRGLYSGAVGYINPEGNFDFNVVIRSLQYNHTNQYLSYMVGGAITWLSDAEKEYDECLLKARAIEELLKG